MASYNELNALIDAYINRNGVQAITGQILNGVLKAMVEQLGRGYTIMGAAIPTTDPGTPDGPECWFASAPGTYTDFDGLQIVPGELALLCYTPTDGWTKETIYEGFQEVQATIDGNVGTPSVGVSYANGVLSFDFRNMKGNPGDAAGFGTIGADIAGGVGTPGVTVESSGPATAKNLQFHFTNLKGETGVTSVVATVDNTTGTPSCAVSLVGQQLTLAFSGLKGAQGDTGVSADYPIAIVNNLTTDDAASALSAAQGKVLDGKVNQLQEKVTDLQDGETVLQQQIDAIHPVVIEGNVENAPDEEDITTDENDRLKFADRSATLTNKGYKILRSDKTFASQVTDINTIYEIRYAFNLDGETISILQGCVLLFNGGVLSNGTIEGQGAALKCGQEKTFDTDLYITGIWKETRLSIANYGARPNGYDEIAGKYQTLFDSTSAIQAALNTTLPIIVPVGNYYVSSTINVPGNSHIEGVASCSGIDGNYYSHKQDLRVSRLFTDKTITIFDVRGTVSITDVVVDTTDVQLSNDGEFVLAFNFNSLYANASSYIRAFVYGNNNAPYNLIGYKFDCDKNAQNANGFLFNLTIDGFIANCVIGTHIPKGNNKTDGSYRWVTGIYLLASIFRARCHHLLESGQYIVISGNHQNGYCLTEQDDAYQINRGFGMTHIDGASNILLSEDSYYWDVPAVNNQIDGYYGHLYGLVVVNHSDSDGNPYEFSVLQPNVYNTLSYKELIRRNALKIVNYSADERAVSPYYNPQINPVNGITLHSFQRANNWQNASLLDVVRNNRLYKYYIGVSNIATIKLYNPNNEEITGITLNTDPLRGIASEQAVTGTIPDGSYIEYSGLGYNFDACFVLVQNRICKIRIRSFEVYSGTTLKYSGTCLLNNVQDVTYLTIGEFSDCKIRLYLENNPGGTNANMFFGLSIVDGNEYPVNVPSVGTAVKSGELTLSHNTNPLKYRTQNNVSFFYSIMYKGATVDRSGLVLDLMAGVSYFDTTLHQMSWYDGTRWLGANGLVAARYRGTTAQRPTSRLTSNDSGFLYYDTDINKMILWNGTAWVNIDGTALS